MNQLLSPLSRSMQILVQVHRMWRTDTSNHFISTGTNRVICLKQNHSTLKRRFSNITSTSWSKTLRALPSLYTMYDSTYIYFLLPRKVRQTVQTWYIPWVHCTYLQRAIQKVVKACSKWFGYDMCLRVTCAFPDLKWIINIQYNWWCSGFNTAQPLVVMILTSQFVYPQSLHVNSIHFNLTYTNSISSGVWPRWNWASEHLNCFTVGGSPGIWLPYQRNQSSACKCL